MAKLQILDTGSDLVLNELVYIQYTRIDTTTAITNKVINNLNHDFFQNGLISFFAFSNGLKHIVDVSNTILIVKHYN